MYRDPISILASIWREVVPTPPIDLWVQALVTSPPQRVHRAAVREAPCKCFEVTIFDGSLKHLHSPRTAIGPTPMQDL